MRLKLLVAVALIMAGIAPVLAAAELFRVSGLPRGGSLSIREEPDVAGATLVEVPVGRRLTGFGCTNETPSGHTWCRVKFGKTVGWARRRYLAPDGRGRSDDDDD